MKQTIAIVRKIINMANPVGKRECSAFLDVDRYRVEVRALIAFQFTLTLTYRDEAKR